MSNRDTLGSAPETAPLRDEPELSAHEAALSLSDDGFDFDEDNDPHDGEPAFDHAERAREVRDDLGRFAPRKPATQAGAANEADEVKREPSDPAAEVDPEDGKDGVAAEPDKDARPETKSTGFVEIDGHQIPVDEVRRGFMRQADYTQKTQGLAEERRTIEARAQKLFQDEAQNTAILELAAEIIKPYLVAKPDRALIATDLVAYQQAMAQYEEQQAHISALQGGYQTLTKRQQDEQRQQRESAQQAAVQQTQAQRMEAFAALEAANPEIKGNEAWTGFFKEVNAYGQKNGFTVQELLQRPDPRTFAMIRKAMAYDKLQAAKPAAIERVRSAPPIRPGVRQGPGTRAGQSQRNAEDAFRRRPTIDGAVATLPDELFGV